MNRQKSRVYRSIRRLRVGHFHFRTALGSRASRDVFMVASPSRNQMGVVDRGDYPKVSNDTIKHEKTRGTYIAKQML